MLAWIYLLSWLSLVYARAFFLSSFVCVLSRASVMLCKAFCSSLVFLSRGAGGKSPRTSGKAISVHFIFIWALEWPRQVLFFGFCLCSAI